MTRIEQLTATPDTQQQDSWHVVWGETKNSKKTHVEWNYDWLLNLLDACLPSLGLHRSDVTTNISHSFTFPRLLEDSATQPHEQAKEREEEEEEDDDDFGFSFGGQDPHEVQPEITQPVTVMVAPTPTPTLPAPAPASEPVVVMAVTEPVVVVMVPSATEAVPQHQPRRTAKEIKAEEIQKQLAEKRAARLAGTSVCKPTAAAAAAAVKQQPPAAPASTTPPVVAGTIPRKKGGVLNIRSDTKQASRGNRVQEDMGDDDDLDDTDE